MIKKLLIFLLLPVSALAQYGESKTEYIDFSKEVGFDNDFISGKNEFNAAVGGSGTYDYNWSESVNSLFGLGVLKTGTTTGSYASIYTNLSLSIFVPNSVQYLMFRGFIVDNQSDSLRCRLGFQDVFTGSSSIDGAYFEINTDSSTTKWRCVTSLASTRTYTTTSISFAFTKTNVFILLIKLADNKCEFFINGVLVATHTTNLPSNGLVRYAVGATVINMTPEARELYLDLMRLRVIGLNRSHTKFDFEQ